MEDEVIKEESEIYNQKKEDSKFGRIGVSLVENYLKTCKIFFSLS